MARLAATRSHVVHPWWRLALQRWFYRLVFSLSVKRSINGIRVGLFSPRKEDEEVGFSKIGRALDLIAECDPVRSRRVRRYVGRVLVFGTEPWRIAGWFDESALCLITEPYFNSTDTSTADLACTLVHEMTHARLCAVGIPYTEPYRSRVESACFREEIRFANRLPDGQRQIETAHRHLSRDASWWTDAEMTKRRFSHLRDEGVPRWLLTVLARLFGQSAA